MAKFELYAPFLSKWEGGFVNDPDDPGGATNRGVTLLVFRKFFGQDKNVSDLKAMTEGQWRRVMKSYWDRVKGDMIESQGVAEMLADWHINAGVGGIKSAQRAFGLKDDGIVGSKSLEAFNREGAFKRMKDARIAFYADLVTKRPVLSKFLCGWLKRVNAIIED